jgi:hypothetical protein
MTISIILTTTLVATLTSPDLCADVYTDENGVPYSDANGLTWSRYCEQTGSDAPVLDHDICCSISGDSATCVQPDSNGRCSTGAAMSCKHGEVTSAGAVVCYQVIPSVCDFGFCGDVAPPNSGPLEDALCCWPNGVCTEVLTVDDFIACGNGGGVNGECTHGVTNEDGSVDCFD